MIKNQALPTERINAIETGGCPHAAIREDISANLGALETLQAKFNCQMLFVESGGDNLAANYSRELADYIIYVIDVSVSMFPLKRVYSNGVFAGWRQDTSKRWSRNIPVRPIGDKQGMQVFCCTAYFVLQLISTLLAR